MNTPEANRDSLLSGNSRCDEITGKKSVDSSPIQFTNNQQSIDHSTFQKSPKSKTSKATNEMSPTDDLSTGSSPDCSRTSSITELDSVHQEEPNHVKVRSTVRSDDSCLYTHADVVEDSSNGDDVNSVFRSRRGIEGTMSQESGQPTEEENSCSYSHSSGRDGEQDSKSSCMSTSSASSSRRGSASDLHAHDDRNASFTEQSYSQDPSQSSRSIIEGISFQIETKDSFGEVDEEYGSNHNNIPASKGEGTIVGDDIETANRSNRSIASSNVADQGGKSHLDVSSSKHWNEPSADDEASIIKAKQLEHNIQEEFIVPQHLQYVTEIQNQIKQQDSMCEDDDDSIEKSCLTISSDLKKKFSSETESASDDEESASVESFRRNLSPHLQYLADVQNRVKHADSYDKTDFSDIHQQIIDVQHARDDGSLSSSSLSYYHQQHNTSLSHISIGNSDLGSRKKASKNSTVDHRKTIDGNYCVQSQNSHSQLDNSNSNFSFLSETENGSSVVDISAFARRNSRSSRNVRRASGETMTSHLSYSTSSSVVSGTNGSSISDMVSQVMKDVREETIPEYQGLDFGRTTKDPDSSSSSESFFSAAQSMHEDSSSFHRRSTRSQRTVASEFYASAVDFDGSDLEQPNKRWSELQPLAENEEEPCENTSTILSQNLQGVMEFFTQTLNAFMSSSQKDVETETNPSSSKGKKSKDVQDGSESLEDGSIGNIDYGYSDEMKAPGLGSIASLQHSKHIRDETETGSANGESVSVSSGNDDDSANIIGSQSSIKEKKERKGSISSSGSGSSGSGSSGSGSSGSDSSSARSEKNAPSCIQRRWYLIVLLVILISGGTGAILFVVLSGNDNGGDQNVQSMTPVESNVPSLAPTSIVKSEFPIVESKEESSVPTPKSKCEDGDETFVFNDIDRDCDWLKSSLRYARAFYNILCEDDGAASTICLQTCNKCNTID